ncbi:MAG: sugar transferase, partial [Candidatus Nealsonbacteria bacterium]|nr:sugar transferase [Candidatus Nealsonbacteria bacterium]
VKPGLTGWAQVNGRNALAWEEKLELDAWYADHWSLRLDVRIAMLTLCRLLRPTGVSHAGSATMPEFMGTVKQNRQAHRPCGGGLIRQ